jgi:hypothetical protein
MSEIEEGAASGGRLEYRHPRWPLFLWGAGAAVTPVVLVWLVVEIVAGPLKANGSFLHLWPWWLTALMWVTILILPVVFCACVVSYWFLFITELQHRDERIVLDEAGVIVRNANEEAHLPWEGLSVGERWFFLQLRAGEVEVRVMKGEWLPRLPRMMAELAARGAATPGSERARDLSDGRQVQVPRYVKLYLLGIAGALLVQLCVVWALANTRFPGSQETVLSGSEIESMAPLAGLAALLAATALACSLLGLQLQPDALRYRNWRGRMTLVPYDRLLSVNWRTPRGPYDSGRAVIRYADAEARHGERRLAFSAGLILTNRVLQRLVEELVRRGGLVQVTERASGAGETWERPAGGAG